MIEVKPSLLIEILDQLNNAQKDHFVLSTQNVIDELTIIIEKHFNLR